MKNMYELPTQLSEDYSSREWTWDVKFVQKPSQPIGDHPLTDTLFSHILYTPSQPIGDHPLWPCPLRVVDNFVRHSHTHIYIYIFRYRHRFAILFFVGHRSGNISIKSQILCRVSKLGHDIANAHVIN